MLSILLSFSFLRRSINLLSSALFSVLSLKGLGTVEKNLEDDEAGAL